MHFRMINKDDDQGFSKLAISYNWNRFAGVKGLLLMVGVGGSCYILEMCRFHETKLLHPPSSLWGHVLQSNNLDLQIVCM